jgi:hypothetical protein
MSSSTAGRYNLSKVQMGFESTPGTPVAATWIWRGVAGHIDSQPVIREVMEQVGLIGGTDRTVLTANLAVLELPETDATYEQLPVLFASGFGGAKTGVADGSGSSGYKYLTTFPTTAGPTMTGKFLTVETGDDVQAEELEYGHVVSINLKGTGGDVVLVTATLHGRKGTETTFTGALSLSTVEEIVFGKGRLYLDAIGGTIGTTQVSEQLLAFDITFNATWEKKYTFDGSLDWTFPHYVTHEITGSLTFEHDSTDIVGTVSEKTNWKNQTARLMRLQILGAALATAGSGTSFSGFKGLRIDLPIKWTKFEKVGEQNLNSIIVANFKSRYNATAATGGSVLIVNEVAAL